MKLEILSREYKVMLDHGLFGEHEWACDGVTRGSCSSGSAAGNGGRGID